MLPNMTSMYIASVIGRDNFVTRCNGFSICYQAFHSSQSARSTEFVEKHMIWQVRLYTSFKAISDYDMIVNNPCFAVSNFRKLKHVMKITKVHAHRLFQWTMFAGLQCSVKLKSRRITNYDDFSFRTLTARSETVMNRHDFENQNEYIIRVHARLFQWPCIVMSILREITMNSIAFPVAESRNKADDLNRADRQLNSSVKLSTSNIRGRSLWVAIITIHEHFLCRVPYRFQSWFPWFSIYSNTAIRRTNLSNETRISWQVGTPGGSGM